MGPLGAPLWLLSTRVSVKVTKRLAKPVQVGTTYATKDLIGVEYLGRAGWHCVHS